MIQNLITSAKNLIVSGLTTVNAVSNQLTQLVNKMTTDVNTIIDLAGTSICGIIGSFLALRGAINAYKIYKERNTGEDFTHNLMSSIFLFSGTGIFATIALIFF